jgi:L-aspartate oxidase
MWGHGGMGPPPGEKGRHPVKQIVCAARLAPASPILLPGVDVLVLGAGLAGLRAAWEALRAAPGAAVAVAAPGPGPSGSSFANAHDRLGLHAPATDQERGDFAREVLELARPGWVDPALVNILAEEALARQQELAALGVSFLSGADGAPQRLPSCFSPQSRRAVAFSGLAAVYRAMAGQVSGRGGVIESDRMAVALVQEAPGGRVRGAVFEDAGGRLFARPAGAVVAAMGGPAPLFLHNQAGRGGTGMGHGLLAAAGARLANTAYLQWMWAELPGLAFWPPWRLCGPQASVCDRAGREIPLPAQVRQAAAGRAGHCPVGHGLPDAALDRFVLAHADGRGAACIRDRAPGGAARLFQAALAAHAGNGGAVVDAMAQTTVPGLFAAGECATGMHGANRLGGAMVAACLVFGARAGQGAVLGMGGDRFGGEHFSGLLARSLHGYCRDLVQRRAVRRFLARILQRHGLPRQEGGPDATLAGLLACRRKGVADAAAAHMIGSAQAFASRPG